MQPVPTELSDAQLNRILLKRREGDVGRGKKIYNRAELSCVKCLAVGGEGGNIGPDLSSIGSAAPADYLVESLIQPSKKIKEGSRMTLIITEDGDVISGLVVREDDNVLIIRNAAGNENRVAKSIIASRHTGSKSMMLSGLVASLREDE